MATQSEKAEAFRALHHRTGPFVLPNAWDVPSARIFEDVGFPAIATSSAGLMVSLGFPDGQGLPRRDLLAAVARIAGRLSVPLSADIVAGYGRGPKEVARFVGRVLDAGAIGINLEDQDPDSHALYRVSAQLRKIRAIRELASRRGIPLVLNARTDALYRAPGEPDARLREAIRRAVAYRDAGADCVYPMGLVDAAAIETFVRELACPVNVMVRKGLPPLAELARLGVQRVSFGPAASYATMGFLRRAGAEILERGSFDGLVEGAISHEDLNALARPRDKASGPATTPEEIGH